MVKIAPSILSADFAHLAADVASVEDEADLIHVDVMDAHFVPNLTIGPPVVASLRRVTSLPLDCHLMISDPGSYVDAFAEAGADSVTVHVEAVPDPAALFGRFDDLGLGRGLSMNPDTPFEAVEPHLDSIDLVLVMTVQPGFGGQSFRDDVLTKIERCAEHVRRHDLPVEIEVDGGISAETVARVVSAGGSVLVAGSAVFGASDPAAAAAEIRRSGEEAGSGAAPLKGHGSGLPIKRQRTASCG